MKILCDSISNYVIRTRVINKKTRRLYPVVEQLDKLLNSQVLRMEKLARLMSISQEKQPGFDPSLDGHLENGGDEPS